MNFESYDSKTKDKSELDDRTLKDVRELFDDMLKNREHYEETFIVEGNGYLSTKERADKNTPLLINFIGEELKTSDDFSKLILELQEKLPEFDFKVEFDPEEAKWIKYTVAKKDEIESNSTNMSFEKCDPITKNYEDEDEETKYIREWFDDYMRLHNTKSYEETFIIEGDGCLSTKERADGNPPFLINLDEEPKTSTEFSKLILELQEKLPEFDFKVEFDPEEAKWIKYTVAKKDEIESNK